MPLLTQQIQDEEDDQYSLVASLDNVRNLSTILKAIHFREHATCFATKNGIKVTVENAKYMVLVLMWGHGLVAHTYRG
uniref:RAD1 checkpoint DNA exonuclease n=1 Tax=Nomascus leucogenys TaxID=61853 RepID=A0A2I3GTD4_NOMLE